MFVVTVIAFAGPVSAYFSSQKLKPKLKEWWSLPEARDRVTDLVDMLEADNTAM